MRPKRWTWAAAVAAALLAVIAIAISTRGDGDTVIVDEPPTTIEEVEGTTPTPQPTPTTTPAPPVRTDGPAWCARTTTVLADIDDDGNYLLEALQAWVQEAPPDMVEAVQEYDALVRTAPPLRAADPDFDTKFEQARTQIDAYVADNC